MGDVEETTHRPALNGATRSYIVTASVCFSIVGLLLIGYAQEEAAKKAKESLPPVASGAPTSLPSLNSGDSAERNKKVEELARKSQGKFSALDKSEQEFLNGLTSGHGQEMLEMNWRSLSGASAPSTSQLPDPETKIRESIERTKGDYSKLTSEEKSKMDGFTMGHGKQYFDAKVELWKKSLQAKSGEGKSNPPTPAVSKK
jgi:hypothetical protein